MIVARPYNSLSGPKTSGANAPANVKIDIAMTACMVVMFRSLATIGRAGAMMVEMRMRLNVEAARTDVTSHFLDRGQSLGFSGSKGAEKVTRKGSACSWSCLSLSGIVVLGMLVAMACGSDCFGRAMLLL